MVLLGKYWKGGGRNIIEKLLRHAFPSLLAIVHEFVEIFPLQYPRLCFSVFFIKNPHYYY